MIHFLLSLEAPLPLHRQPPLDKAEKTGRCGNEATAVEVVAAVIYAVVRLIDNANVVHGPSYLSPLTQRAS